MRRPDSQAGSALVIALLGLVAVLAVGGLAVMTVRSQTVSMTRGSQERIALYAAEAGVQAAVDFLARSCGQAASFSLVLGTSLPANFGQGYGQDMPNGTCADGSTPGSDGECPGAPFFSQDGFDSAGVRDTSERDYDQYFEVSFADNSDDPSSSATDDGDETVVIRSTGHGPAGAQAMILAAYHSENCVATVEGGYAMEGGGDAKGPVRGNITKQRIDTGAHEETPL